MSKKWKPCICVLSTLVLLLPTLSLFSSAFADTSDVTYIKTETEFIEFAENCQLDSYSEGRHFVLTADLDLTNYNYSPAPIFKGFFEGNSHIISGVTVEVCGSTQGIFRINEGTIRNLDIRAIIHATDSATNIGIIAGENRGRILRCDCFGKIEGKNNVGGIAGINSEGGEISDSKSRVTVTGTTNTGGIVGLNKGILHGCRNFGNINTSQNQVRNTNIQSIASIRNELLDEENTSTFEVFSCAGGIAGKSSGHIEKCTNSGNIGYPHLGYNVGGIVGLFNGSIVNCNNSGTIEGRKDVGGIAGQFEPHIELEYSKQNLDTLKQETDTLLSFFRQVNDKVHAGSQDALTKSETINTSLKEVEETLKNTGTNINNLTDEKMEIFHQAFTIINDTNKKILDDFNTYSTEIIDDTYELSAALISTTAEINGMLENINEEVTHNNQVIANSREELIIQRDRLLALGQNINHINQNINEKSEQINQEVSTLHEGIEKLTEALNRVANNQGSIVDNMADINSGLNTILTSTANLSRLINTIIQESSDDINEMMSAAFDAIKKVLDEIQIINDSLQNSATDIVETNKEAYEVINDNQVIINESSKRLHTNIATLNNLLDDYLSTNNEQSKIIEQALKETFDFVNDSLHSSYDDVYKESITINETLGDLIDNSSVKSNELYDLNSSIILSFETISNTLEDMMKKPEYDYENLFDLDPSKTIEGSLIESTNNGNVNGDNHVGGVCGVVDFEIGNNPEEEFNADSYHLGSTTAFLRAIIYHCQNNGSISAKTDYAGGITGKSITGVIYESSNKGNIQGINYLGGISGYTEGEIRKCNVLCDIDGTSYIGGIGGYAATITENNAMVQIQSIGEKIGAIAGEVKDDSEINENIFVKEKIGGIDGISYAFKAYPVNYSEFITLERVPDYFDTLFIRFYDGKDLITKVQVDYNGSIAEKDIPKTTFDEETYSEWDAFTTENIIRSQDVYLRQKPWISTITTNEKIPLFLAEGRFFPEARLLAEPLAFECEVSLFSEYKNARAYQLQVTNNQGNSQEYLLRAKLNKGEEIVIISDSSPLLPVKAEMDGSYAVFPVKNNTKIAILQKNHLPRYTSYGVGALIMVILLFFLIRSKKNVL